MIIIIQSTSKFHEKKQYHSQNKAMSLNCVPVYTILITIVHNYRMYWHVLKKDVHSFVQKSCF